jgi:hypothetical protein
MNKLYFIIPFAGLLIFGGFYWNFDQKYEAQIAAKKAAAEAELKAKQQKDQEARQLAYQQAIEAAARRKAEREEKARIEEEKKKARLEAEDRREHNFTERNRLREQVASLKKDLDAVHDEIKKLDEEKKSAVAEQAFLREYVRKAETNQKYYYELLDKIAAAEDARAKAEAAAKAANKG